MAPMELVQAQALYPGPGDSVVLHGGTLLACGRAEELVVRYPQARQRRIPGIIMPGLVNAHCHLELAVFGTPEPPQPEETFTDWVTQLMVQRDATCFTEVEQWHAAADFAAEQYRSGVVLLADTGNTLPPPDFAAQKGLPQILSLLECIAPTAGAVQNARMRLQSLPEEIAATAHAPYSVVPELLQEIHARCRRLGQLFSIHTAETPQELDFVRHRRGIFRTFLERRNAWDGSFTTSATVPEADSAIALYHRLGLLSAETLLVHCTNPADGDFALLQQSCASLCLCPGSNAFLRVGRPPVARLEAVAGERLCLGTDSITSNPQPDLWHEMTLLHELGLSPRRILTMATEQGAAALGKSEEYGTMVPGRSSALIAVNSPAIAASLAAGCDSAELARTLVLAGRPQSIFHITST